MLVAFWPLAFPRDSSSGLTKGVSVTGQQQWSQPMGSPSTPPLATKLMDQEGLELWFCSVCLLELPLISPAFFSPWSWQSHFIQVIFSKWCRIKRARARGSSPACSGGAGNHKVGPKGNPRACTPGR